MRRRFGVLALGVLLVGASQLRAEALDPSAAPAVCPAEPGDAARTAAETLLERFRTRFAPEVRIPDWCFGPDDHAEVAAWLVRGCRDHPALAREEALALVALKAGRCAGFEAGRRSQLGEQPRDEGGPRFGVR